MSHNKKQTRHQIITCLETALHDHHTKVIFVSPKSLHPFIIQTVKEYTTIFDIPARFSDDEISILAGGNIFLRDTETPDTQGLSATILSFDSAPF